MSVYYVHAPETGLVKIGFAKDPVSRFAKMQVDSPTRLVLLSVEEGGKVLEKIRHEQFTAQRARGEWFRFEGPLSDFVGQLPPFVRAPRKAVQGALGAWLRRNGHTLVSFAELVGTTHSTLSRVCSGQQFPRREVMLRIIEATDWEIDANALLNIPQRPAKADAA